MTRKKEQSIWSQDPVVQEVRAARAKLWAGRSIEEVMRLVRERAAAIRNPPARMGKKRRST